MMSGYLVSYNGLFPWGSGEGASTPYVSIDTDYLWEADNIGYDVTVSLNGIIPSGGIEQLVAIRDTFSENFKAFRAPGIYLPSAFIESVNFESQNFIGITNWSATLKGFSGMLYGVINPVNKYDFQEQENRTIKVIHSISADGVCYNGNTGTAFTNAKNFVLTYTGLSQITNGIIPAFNSSINISNAILLSVEEQIDRIGATYGVTETWLYDPLRTDTTVFKRFSATIESGISDDYISVNIDATYKGNKLESINSVRDAIDETDFQQIATSIYAGINTNPITFNVDLDQAGKSANVRATYDNSPEGSFFDYTVDVSKDYTKDFTNFSVNGRIIGSGRHVRRQFEQALSYYNSTMGGLNGVPSYLYSNVVSPLNTSLSASTHNVNPTPTQYNVEFNSGQGSIDITAVFTDGPYVEGYSSFEWDVSVDCGLNLFVPLGSANKNGIFVIQDMDTVNRTSVNINGNFGFPSDGNINQTKHLTVLTKLKNEEGTQNGFVESEGYSEGEGQNVTKSYTYSYTKNGCGLSLLPSNAKIYQGV